MPAPERTWAVQVQGLKGEGGQSIFFGEEARKGRLRMTKRKRNSETNRNEVSTPVDGGRVTRDATSGRFLMVQGSSGTFKAASASEDIVKSVSSKHSEALKRLANR
jgi:hypothetical protein